jgi:hypothetical protein
MIRRDTQAAIAAALISLAGSVLASLIALMTQLVKGYHIPPSTVLAHAPKVVSLLPHTLDWFGFLCWALAAYSGWRAVVGRRRTQAARMSGGTWAVGQGQLNGQGPQTYGSPGGQPDLSGAGFAAPPGPAPEVETTQPPGTS